MSTYMQKFVKYIYMDKEKIFQEKAGPKFVKAQNQHLQLVCQT